MRRTAALALLLLVAAAPAPPVPVYRAFGRWFVACDNVRSCEARGFGDASRTDLRLVLAAGDAKPTLTLSAAETPLEHATIHLDAAPLALAPPAWRYAAENTDHPPQLSTSDPAAIRTFIAAARNAHSLQLGAPGPDTDSVPLDGMTAALLLVDAVQGRPGTPTALVAAAGSGQPPRAPAVPKPPAWMAPPALTPAETRTLLARARKLPSPKDAACDQTDAPDVHALDATSAIAIRACEAFAYQGSSLVYVLPRVGTGPAQPVVLPLPGLPKGEADPTGPEMTDPAFNAANGRLYTSAKGRGVADCGMSASWVSHDGAFRLVSLSYQDQCGGAAPGDWPALFRTTGKQ